MTPSRVAHQKTSKASPPPYRAKSFRKAADLPSFDSKHILLSRPDLNHLTNAFPASGSDLNEHGSSLDSFFQSIDGQSVLDTITQEHEPSPADPLWAQTGSPELAHGYTTSSSSSSVYKHNSRLTSLGSSVEEKVGRTRGVMDSKRSKKGSCPNWDTREFVCIKTQPTSYKASERERRASLMSEDLSLPQTVALHEATASYHAVLARMKASIPPVLFNGALGVVVGKIVGASVIAGLARGSGTFIRRTQSKWSPPVFIDLSYKTLGLGGVRGEFVALLMSETSVHELYKTGRTTLRVDIKAGSGLRPSTTSYSRTSEAIVYGRHTGFTFGVSSSPLNIALKPESVHRSLYGEHVTTRTLLKRAWPMSTHLPLIQLADAFDQNSQAPGWS